MTYVLLVLDERLSWAAEFEQKADQGGEEKTDANGGDGRPGRAKHSSGPMGDDDLEGLAEKQESGGADHEEPEGAFRFHSGFAVPVVVGLPSGRR